MWRIINQCRNEITIVISSLVVLCNALEIVSLKKQVKELQKPPVVEKIYPLEEEYKKELEI